jgi:FtsP/CotA-like multicopper oxidase with cupredoxin domain
VSVPVLLRLLFLVLSSALVSSAAAPAFGQHAPTPVLDRGPALFPAVDRNPAPAIVEVDLVAREADVEIGPGETVHAWTYDGRIPGPLLRGKVGDRLIVHFTNQLTSSTTIHWHGLRVPNGMDGVPEHTQPQVPPGGSFTYDFVLRDAGFFWYHPHLMSAAQVGFGLYGALLVDDPDDPVRIEDERVLVLSDIAISGGELEHPDSGGTLGMAFGREGNRVLVNGRTNVRMTAREGALQRWRIVNAAKSRYFLLDLEGQPFTVIGTDGGRQERAEPRDSVVLTPGERLDVIVAPRRPEYSDTLVLRSGLFNRGFGSVEFRRVEELVHIAFVGPPGAPAPAVPQPTRRIEPTSRTGATDVRITMTLQTLENGALQYGIDGKAFGEGLDVTARVGETQVWTITNKTKWSHPFHLHGFFFQVLDEHGEPVRPLAWKDTVDVPFEQTVRIVVKFDERPGMWMYHCHILDHADGGLMGMVHLLPATASEGSAGQHP